MYNCRWGTDTIRVVVARELPREAHNAPLHLFSASPDLIEFGGSVYQRRSQDTSLLLRQLFERLKTEDFAVSYTMEDFRRDYVKEHFPQLTPEEQEELLQSLPPERQEELLRSLPPEKRLAGLSAKQIREYLDRLPAERPRRARKPQRKKR